MLISLPHFHLLRVIKSKIPGILAIVLRHTGEMLISDSLIRWNAKQRSIPASACSRIEVGTGVFPAL